MSSKSDRMIAKLKKLLAMAQDKSSENEAMIAAKQLHSLLAKYNLSMSDIEAEEDSVDSDHMVQKCRPWKRIVAYNIAKLYFCDMYFVRLGKGNSRYVFMGTDSNRIFAMHITSMIFVTLEREARKESREVYGKEVPSFVNSYWTAATERIAERCQELINSAKEGSLQDEEGNTMPVLASVYDQAQNRIDTWKESKNLKLKESKNTTKVTDRAGQTRGRQAGDKVQLSRSVGQSNNRIGAAR